MLEIVLFVLAGLLLVVVVLLAVGFARFRSIRVRHRRRVAVVDPEHSEPASLLGLASEGTVQTHGAGTLAVGTDQLIFAQLVPERDILIPRTAITSTRASRHFLGKTTGKDLLVVTWDVDGMGEAAAFVTPDVGAWRDRLA